MRHTYTNIKKISKKKVLSFNLHFLHNTYLQQPVVKLYLHVLVILYQCYHEQYEKPVKHHDF